ncbi:SLC6A1 [Lepeophtheirus salmonis]|uniref:SLC6A1 n=1 Tax=Lepeophtheirus salmonis TaxID=72036 RepID=A0A7R8HAP6_LEPSM|nr:SLC6A1 [Lepeophtheirus salmonis]CAF2959632.1 SLC6A1 [Lepeophtheirus salmonis]
MRHEPHQQQFETLLNTINKKYKDLDCFYKKIWVPFVSTNRHPLLFDTEQPKEPTPPPSYEDATKVVDLESEKPKLLDESSTKGEERGYWKNPWDFLFSCISVSVGLGNVWRFPYLCYKNSGGVFLIIYFITMIFCGIPIFLMEVAIGQYLGAGGMTTIGQICPIMKGVGIATMIVIENTANCWTQNISSTPFNDSTTPVEEFWTFRVLKMNGGIEYGLGSLNWELVGTLLIGWILVYLIICRGLHQSGYVIWFTALFPYFVMITLLVRALTLEGAIDGLKAYVKLDWRYFYKGSTWIDAATQIFFAYSVGTGALPALGSYNRFNHNCFRDAFITCVINTATCLMAGVLVFSILGYMAHLYGTTVDQVAASGPGLVFITYPELVLNLPISYFWAIIFFSMLLVLGIDTEFCSQWEFACVFFFLGLPMVTEGGIYLFQIMDFYSASGMSLLWICFFETIAISWFYGAEKFSDNIKEMIGRRPNLFLRLCWKFFGPFVMAGVFIYYCISYSPVEFGEYQYPKWSEVMGLLIISFSSMIWIPGYAVYYILNQPGSLIQNIKMGMISQINVRRDALCSSSTPTAPLVSQVSVPTIITTDLNNVNEIITVVFYFFGFSAVQLHISTSHLVINLYIDKSWSGKSVEEWKEMCCSINVESGYDLGPFWPDIAELHPVETLLYLWESQHFPRANIHGLTKTRSSLYSHFPMDNPENESSVYPKVLTNDENAELNSTLNLPGSLHDTQEIVEPVNANKENERIMDLIETLECPICFNICSTEPILSMSRRSFALNRTAESLASKLSTLVRENELIGNTQLRDGIIISVVEPLKVGKGLMAKIVFKIESHSLDGKNRFSVSRKYGDIVKLHYKLYGEHFKNGIIVPPPPVSKIVDVNSLLIKFSTMEEIKNQSKNINSIRKRTASLNRYFNRIAKHNILRKDPHFRAFIQENELPNELTTVKKPGFFKRNPKLLEWFSFQEKNPWFQTRMNRLEELSHRLKSFENDLRALSRMKEQLVKRDVELQRNMVQLNVTDTPRFSVSMSKAMNSHQKSCSIYWNQCVADIAIVDLLEDYGLMIQSALSTIAYRRKKKQIEFNKLKKKKDYEAEMEDSEESLTKINQQVQRELEHFEVMMSQEFEEQFLAYNRTYYETLHTEETMDLVHNHI